MASFINKGFEDSNSSNFSSSDDEEPEEDDTDRSSMASDYVYVQKVKTASISRLWPH